MSDPILIPIAFIAGFVSFLGPCHIAMIPIFVSYLLANKDQGRLQGFAVGCAYTLGLAITFSFYNFILQILPETIYYLPIFRILAGLIICLLAVSLLFGLNIGTSTVSKSKLFQKLSDNYSTLGFGIFGVISGLAWIPCFTPVLATILTTITINQEFIYGYFLLVVYALGLGVPYIVISTLGLQVKTSTLAKWMKYGIWAQKGLAIILLFLGIVLILDGVNLYLIYY